MKKLFIIKANGYDDIYVLAEDFNESLEKWHDEYINTDEDMNKIPVEERVYPMPDSIIYCADENQIIF